MGILVIFNVSLLLIINFGKVVFFNFSVFIKDLNLFGVLLVKVKFLIGILMSVFQNRLSLLFNSVGISLLIVKILSEILRLEGMLMLEFYERKVSVYVLDC